MRRRERIAALFGNDVTATPAIFSACATFRVGKLFCVASLTFFYLWTTRTAMSQGIFARDGPFGGGEDRETCELCLQMLVVSPYHHLPAAAGDFSST